MYHLGIMKILLELELGLCSGIVNNNGVDNLQWLFKSSPYELMVLWAKNELSIRSDGKLYGNLRRDYINKVE